MAYEALRTNTGMVTYFGHYDKVEAVEQDLDGKPSNRYTDNIILEYAKLDLDGYFGGRSSPVIDSGSLYPEWDELDIPPGPSAMTTEDHQVQTSTSAARTNELARASRKQLKATLSYLTPLKLPNDSI